MKRVLYTIPLFFLLIPWLFWVGVVFVVGLMNPYALFLLLPTSAVLGSAFYMHRQRSKFEQHGLAAVIAGLILTAPIAVLLSVFFCGGGEQYTRHQLADDGVPGYITSIPSGTEVEF